MYICEEANPHELLSHSKSVCDTEIAHIGQHDIILYITHFLLDVPNYMSRFEAVSEKISSCHVEISHNVHCMRYFNLSNVRLPDMMRNGQGQVKSLLNLNQVYYVEHIVIQLTRANIYLLSVS